MRALIENSASCRHNLDNLNLIRDSVVQLILDAKSLVNTKNRVANHFLWQVWSFENKHLQQYSSINVLIAGK